VRAFVRAPGNWRGGKVGLGSAKLSKTDLRFWIKPRALWKRLKTMKKGLCFFFINGEEPETFLLENMEVWLRLPPYFRFLVFRF
jgi:hypothetical protein